MKHCSKLLFLIALLFSGNYIFSQDLIVKKDGAKIRCKIVDENSTTLYYSIGEQKTLFDIKKADVENYYIAANTGFTPSNPLINAPKKTELLMLDLTAGLAVPFGTFADQDIKNATAGLARPGFLLQASVKLRLVKYFGICAAFRHQENGVSTDNYNAAFAAQNKGITFTTASTNWISNGLFGGLYFSIPQDREKKFFIDLDVYAGYPKFTSPELDTKGTVSSVVVGTETLSSVKASAFTIMEGVGFHYKATEFIAFHGGINFITAKPAFKDEHIVSGSNSVYYDFSQRITTFNLQIGLSILVY